MGRLRIEKTSNSGNDEIRVNRDGVSGRICINEFQDKDTLQYVYYCPSFEVSGYGETKELAFEMVESSIEDFFEYLLGLSLHKREAELAKLGWKKQSIFNKRYSKAFVDANGELQNFNALDNKVERLTLVAA